jgi:hypothetical protein
MYTPPKRKDAMHTIYKSKSNQTHSQTMDALFSVKHRSANTQRAIREVAQMHDLYVTTPIAKIVANTIIEKILMQGLKYHTINTKIIDDSREVPFTVDKLVRSIVESIVQLGFFAYRITKTKTTAEPANAGLIDISSGDEAPLLQCTIEIAHPLRIYPFQHPDGTLEAIDNTQTHSIGTTPIKWKAMFFRDPCFESPQTPIITSVLAAAAPTIAHLKAMVTNYTRRDLLNSSHAGFATVSPAVATVGAGQTWLKGRDAAADESLAPYLANHMNYEQIVRDRTSVIQRFISETALSRNVADEGPLAHTELSRDVNNIAKQFVEHLVSDGHTFKAAEPLVSMGNAAHHYDRLESAILITMQVPPQALGKNINSERLASSNTLTMTSLEGFQNNIKRFKRAVMILFEEAAQTNPQHTHVIAFTRTIPQTEFADINIFPLLKPERAQECLAIVHDVPHTYFNKQAIIRMQETLHDDNASTPTAPTRKRKRDQHISPERADGQRKSTAQHAAKEHSSSTTTTKAAAAVSDKLAATTT